MSDSTGRVAASEHDGERMFWVVCCHQARQVEGPLCPHIGRP